MLILPNHWHLPDFKSNQQQLFLHQQKLSFFTLSIQIPIPFIRFFLYLSHFSLISGERDTEFDYRYMPSPFALYRKFSVLRNAKGQQHSHLCPPLPMVVHSHSITATNVCGQERSHPQAPILLPNPPALSPNPVASTFLI